MSHFLAHSSFTPRPHESIDIERAIVQALSAYEAVVKRTKVNEDKKRKYLRAAFVQKVLEKQHIIVTEANVVNTVKTLDRRQSKRPSQRKASRKNLITWTPAPLTYAHDSGTRRDPVWDLKRMQKLQYRVACDLFYYEDCGVWSARQQSGYDVAIWLDQDATQKALNPRIIVTSPWQLSRAASFICKMEAAPELEDRSRARSENNWDFPDGIAEAILQGNAREVLQIVELHYTAADLNRLLHLHLSNHEPITSLAITYNLIRQAPPQAPKNLHAMSNDTMLEPGAHPLGNLSQPGHPPNAITYTGMSDTFLPNCLASEQDVLSMWGFPYQQCAPSSALTPYYDFADPLPQTTPSILALPPQGLRFGAWVSRANDTPQWPTENWLIY